MDLLPEDEFEIIPGGGAERDPWIAEQGIETYLIPVPTEDARRYTVSPGIARAIRRRTSSNVQARKHSTANAHRVSSPYT